MAASKLQTTAIVTLALFLLAIPATLIIRESQIVPSTPTDTAATASDEPDYLAPYIPLSDQPLKFVSAPPDIRIALYHHLVHHRGEPPTEHMMIRWDPDRPYWSGSFNNADVTVDELIGSTLNLYSQEIEMSPALAKTVVKIPGDVVIRQNPQIEQSLPQLEKLFQQQFHLALKLSLRDIPMKAIVFRGHWVPTPHPDSPPSESPLVQIYMDAVEKITNADSSPGGGQTDVARAIGECIHRDVFIESDNPPRLIRYRFNDAMDFDATVPDRKPNTPNQINAILNHISEQTNLPWSEETRIVRHLFIEPSK